MSFSSSPTLPLFLPPTLTHEHGAPTEPLKVLRAPFLATSSSALRAHSCSTSRWARDPLRPLAALRAQGQPQQVSPCRDLKTSHSPNGPSSLTCPCEPHGALGPDASSDQSSLPLRIHPSFPPGSPAPSAATYPGPGAAAASRRRCPGRSGPSNPRCRAGSPYTSLPPPPAPLFQATGVLRGAWKLIPQPEGNETTLQAGTLATGQANTQGGGLRIPESRWEEGASYLFLLFLHTPHQRGAGRRGGSLQVVPTPIAPHPHFKFILGLPWGQLSRSTCWVAPDCSCPSTRGSKQVRWGAGRECTAGESDVSYKACRQPSEKPVLTLRENQIQMCSGIPTFLQPIAGLLEGLEPSSTVVNLRHLAVYKPSICVYHLFAIWEFGLTRATLEMSLISLFIHLSIVFLLIYLVHFFYWICRNKKNAFFPGSISSHLLLYGEVESDPSIFWNTKASSQLSKTEHSI